MIETHVTAMLARFAAELRFEDLPAETVEHIKIYLADWFAASFAGEKVNGAYNCAVREILFDMGGKEEASVMFSDRRLPVMHAAFLHATLAHGADMDDACKETVEIAIGPLVKQYPVGVSFLEGDWLFQLTQPEAFALSAAGAECKIRVKFKNGDVIGVSLGKVSIAASRSKAVL